MPQERLRKDVFRDAALQVYAYKVHGTCAMSCIEKCIEAIEFLMSNGEELKEQNLPVMDYVDAAIRHIYPGLGRADTKELKTLLAEEKEILEKIRDGSLVKEGEFDQISIFSQEMWVQLDLAERGRPPHRVPSSRAK